MIIIDGMDISVVIPVYNEATMLPSCLESLKEQDFKGIYEIIVVDNNSTDLTPQIAKLYGTRIVKETQQGVVFARQTGFTSAHGRIICSTDADTIVPPNWLTTIYSIFLKDNKLVAVAGRYDLIGINSFSKLVYRLLLPFLFVVDWLVAGGGSLAGSNMAVLASAFKEVGGFDTTMASAEDIDLGRRLKKKGRVKVDLSLKVKTSARRVDWGWGNLFLYAFNALMVSVRSRPFLTSFKNIRQRVFEAYDSFNDSWFAGFATVSGVIAILAVGAIPGFNLWSVSHIKTSDKVIALTFDDGPNEPYTQQILDVLREKQIRATFFVVGENAIRHPELVKEAYDEGDLIGNHTWSHSRFLMLEKPSKIKDDVGLAENAIAGIIGKNPRMFRPPYGYRSAWGAKTLAGQGYKIVTWDDQTSDWGKLSSKQITINIIRRAKPGGIIDLHDGGENRDHVDRSKIVRSVEEIVDLLQAEGYKFVTLDELFGQPGYF